MNKNESEIWEWHLTCAKKDSDCKGGSKNIIADGWLIFTIYDEFFRN